MLLIIRVHLNLIVSREPSMKDIRSNPHVLSIMISVIGRGNSSFGHSSFRSRKSILTLPIFLGNGDNIGYPIGVLLLPDEARVYELFDFWLDSFHSFWTEPSLLLFDWFRVWINVEAMHSHSRIKPRHVLVIPSENIYILSHERYQIFLFGGW